MRCTGHCCENFWLPVSPMELSFQAKLASIGKSKWDQSDILKVKDMAIFIRKDPKKGNRYTCKYLDKETGDCKNYANRPTMCKAYPYGKPCTYKACTMRNNCGVE